MKAPLALPGRTVERRVAFSGGLEKARWLDSASKGDADHVAVRRLAARFRSLPPMRRAAALHQWVRDRIRYVRDPGREQFADATTVLQRRFDDCDGKARLFVALARAAGLEARIRPIMHGDDFVHVQAEVRLAGHPRADREGWVVCEFILRGVPLGSGIEAARRDDAGRLLYV